MRVGRNEACPCGSGNKYKSCCAGKASQKHSKGLVTLVGVIGVIAAVGLIPLLSGRNDKTSAPLPSAAAPLPAPVASTTNPVQPVASTLGTPAAQPAGTPPPGKVWSTEHGHWHDAPGAAGAAPSPVRIESAGSIASPIATSTAAAMPGTPIAMTPIPKSQPPGPAPAGKVWSAEHGHWHNADGTADATPSAPVAIQPVTLGSRAQPPGPAPAGKVWSAEHGHWHETNTGTTPQPAPAPQP